jgi:hypothetical protein
MVTTMAVEALSSQSALQNMPLGTMISPAIVRIAPALPCFQLSQLCWSSQ